MSIKRYDEIMTIEINNMVAKQNKLTDFNEGSIIHSFLDTVARIAERIYVAIRQGYNDNLKIMPYSIFGFEKKDGRFASGFVVFSREEPLNARSIITRGTKVSSGDLTFTTTDNAVIEPGETDSNRVPIVADKIGIESNLPAGTVKHINSNVPADVIYVDNPAALVGGTDEESDADFEQRFKFAINGMSGTNTYAIKEAALSINAVRSVSIQEHKPPLNNIYNVSIYVDDGSGKASDATLAEVKNIIEGDLTELNPGHLVPGVNVRYATPTILPVDISCVISYFSADETVIRPEVEKVVSEYVNSLTISESVVIADIVTKLMALGYVKDVKILNPLENITPDISQICRLGELELSLVEVN